MAYVCECCGKAHDGLPLDIVFAKPGAYLALTPRQQKSNCVLTEEICTIGKKRFFIRGSLPVPLLEIGNVFVWGVWAEVSRPVFERYRKVSQTGATEELPSFGALSVEREPLLRGIDQLPVMIRFGADGKSPTLVVEPSNHWLCRDQQNGITLHRLHQMLHAFFPHHF
jgi:hypothetical protein